jgi:hypothetical protein
LELLAVCALDPVRDVRNRDHAEEIDVDRLHALILGLSLHPPKQRGLSVSPRSDEARVAAVQYPGEEFCGFGVSVNEIANRDRAFIRERTGDAPDDSASVRHQMA